MIAFKKKRVFFYYSYIDTREIDTSLMKKMEMSLFQSFKQAQLSAESKRTYPQCLGP